MEPIFALAAFAVLIIGGGAGFMRMAFCRGRRWGGLGMLAASALFCVCVLAAIGPAPLPGPPADAPKAASLMPKAGAGPCGLNIACIGDQHLAAASRACVPAIDRLAEYGARWTDGWLDVKFIRYVWTDKPGGPIVFIGDKINFLNAYGAPVPMIYACTFDQGAGVAIAAEAAPGRL